MEPALSPAAVCQVMNLAGSEQDQILFCQYKLLYFLLIYSYVLGVAGSLRWQTLGCQGGKGLHACKGKERC